MGQRLSLLYVMGEFPSLYQGTVLNEIRLLRSRGYPVHILARRWPQHPNHAAADALADSTIYGLDLQGGYAEVLRANLGLILRIGPAAYREAWRLVKRFRVMGNLKGFMRMAAAAYRLKGQGFTHLHAHWANEATELAMILSQLMGLPFSFTCHAVDIFVAPRYLKEKLRAARFVVTVSGYNKQYLLDHYGSDLADKIHVIYPLIDIQQFGPRPPVHSDGINILSIGRLVEKKGYRYAVEAAGILKERGHQFVWKIVGEGRDRPQLEATVSEQGLSGWVQLLGRLPHADVHPLLEQATVFVLPSVVASNGDREGMPAVLIEAMAREVPVVATSSVGIGELVKDGAGLLVPPRDGLALAEAVEQVITADPATQQAMGGTGRQIVEQEFDVHHLANKLLVLFESQSH
jgi:colanic acid/amylovoran biosynthesis glycosyltransferase